MPWPKTPCKGCEKRESGCHIDCNDYLYFKKEVALLRKNMEIERIKNYPYSHNFYHKFEIKGSPGKIYEKN